MNDFTEQFQKQIFSACKNHRAVRIEGNNTKAFMGNRSDTVNDGEIIRSQQHSGILSYDPSELVIKVRSGTRLDDINDALAEHNQALPFEPNSFDGNATIGGTIACNISGPARAYKGAARDYLLGASIINGKGEMLEFGGQVMKNVAGYDASRLMAGAMGTLGFILDVSIKVLPKNKCQQTIKIQQPVNQAILSINKLSAKNLPINASAYIDDALYIRLSSSEKNTAAASTLICQQTDGSIIDNSEDFWRSLTEQQHAFFQTDKPLIRLSVPATSNTDSIDGEQLVEWSGALRWLKTETPVEDIRHIAKSLGGHATAYKNFSNDDEYFQPLDSVNLKLQQRLKDAFDPAGILNPGRLYKTF